MLLLGASEIKNTKVGSDTSNPEVDSHFKRVIPAALMRKTAVYSVISNTASDFRDFCC